jgi:hypothetical protein
MATLRRLEALEQRGQIRSVQHITEHTDHTEIYATPHSRLYYPTPTATAFHSDDSFVKLVIGCYGSGKSTLCINDLRKRAEQMPVWSNGRRRSRGLIIRNTSGELHTTTLQTWLQWFGELGDVKYRQKPLLTYEHTWNDGHGIVELELIFLALDRPDDVRKLKSMEATFAYLNELSELPQNVLAHIKGRVNGRYPSKSFCAEPYWSGIIADTNPCDTDHWIYKDFEVNKIDSYKVFHQPPGLLKDKDGKWIQNPNCDNAANLSSDYYVRLAEQQSQGFIKVYCLGEYGIVESGKRVYPEYNDDIHSADKVHAIQGEPIHLGWDFGLTPACAVIQISARGQLRILKEYTVEHMGIRNFAKSIVLPSLAIDFPYNKIGESWADPSGMAGDDIMEELSCIGELNSLGIKTQPANTNDVDVRVGSVRYFLNVMIDGQPALILDRANCPILRKGFINGYHFKRMNIAGEDRYQDKPNKNLYSHPHDGLQYIAMRFAADQIVQHKAPVEKVDMYNPTFRWTN